jgi:acetyltransferase-like isoleucine patch superfamily enzyme
MITRVFQKIWLKHLRSQGLQIANDCRVMGFPSFGSEPFLISIAENVTISSHVVFITHDGGTFVFRDQPGFEKVIKYGRITVRKNCFVGARAIILPGVEIGPNAIIAAGAVVTRDVPPGSIAAGVPARIVGRVSEYRESCKTRTPRYDVTAYHRDKKRELLRQFPRPW